MNKGHSFASRLAALLLLWTFASPAFALGGTGSKALTDDQKILHVLNRLGFGPRPGDVERVRALGLQKYIERQLDPAAIDDAALESKVRNLEVFNMSTAEVFAKYPNPGALLRQLEGGRQAQARPNRGTTPAASRRSSIRLLVQLPMKTCWTSTSRSASPNTRFILGPSTSQ